MEKLQIGIASTSWAWGTTLGDHEIVFKSIMWSTFVCETKSPAETLEEAIKRDSQAALFEDCSSLTIWLKSILHCGVITSCLALVSKPTICLWASRGLCAQVHEARGSEGAARAPSSMCLCVCSEDLIVNHFWCAKSVVELNFRREMIGEQFHFTSLQLMPKLEALFAKLSSYAPNVLALMIIVWPIWG